jgi:hypothetical protein
LGNRSSVFYGSLYMDRYIRSLVVAESRQSDSAGIARCLAMVDPLASAAITTFYIDAGAGERLARINCGLHGRANIVEASQIPKTEKEPL